MNHMLSTAARTVRRSLPLPSASGARPPRRLVLALLALCAVAFWIRLAHISGTLPYPRHIDELRITVRAHRMVTTGEYHPVDFIYPSLPRYLAAAAMAAGVAWTSAESRPAGTDPVGLWTYPHYERPAVIGAARRLFALLSIVALGATGLAAWRLLNWPGAVLLAPLVLATSPLFFVHSWEYLNVDVVATCFAALAIAACLHGTRQPSILSLAVLPAICAGLAAGSKYPSGLVLLPVLVASALFLAQRRRLRGVAVAAATAGAAFVAVVPHSVLDFPTFLGGLTEEAGRYLTGNDARYRDDPGLAQLAFYGRHFQTQFGWTGLVAAGIGLAAAAAADWRRTLVFVSFPLALLALLTPQRAQFARNVLPLHPFLAVLVAGGLAVAHGRLVQALERRGRTPRRLRHLLPAAAWLAICAIGLATPLARLPDQTHTTVDSRWEALDWLDRRLPTYWTLIVPAELNIDLRELQRRGYALHVVDYRSLGTMAAVDAVANRAPGPVAAFIPRWGHSEQSEGTAAAARRAAELNRTVSPFVPLASFGRNPILVNYPFPVPWGDPAFSIAARSSISRE